MPWGVPAAIYRTPADRLRQKVTGSRPAERERSGAPVRIQKSAHKGHVSTFDNSFTHHFTKRLRAGTRPRLALKHPTAPRHASRQLSHSPPSSRSAPPCRRAGCSRLTFPTQAFARSRKVRDPTLIRTPGVLQKSRAARCRARSHGASRQKRQCVKVVP